MRRIKINPTYTNREESEVINMYFNDINRENVIKPDEEATLAKRIREKDNQALDKLVRANLKFVISVAKQYKNGKIPLLDLINEGNIGLIKAAHKFDEKKGFKFISYAVWWIRQSILQAINNHSKIVRVPANVKGHHNEIKKTILKFEQQNEREPIPEEIAEILEQDPNSIYHTLYSEGTDTSLDNTVSNEEEEYCLYEVLENKSVDATDHQLAFKQSLKQEVMRALSTLDPREEKVVKMSYGIDYDHAMNFEEIGNKLGLTRERIRQIKLKALKKLKSKNTSKLLKAYCAR